MKSGILNKLLTAAAALAFGFGVAASAVAEDKLKVGFVYVGPVGDHGWTYRHDVGRQAIEEKLGEKVETTFVENVAEGADAERVINQLAASGHKLIFTTSFGFMNPTVKVAKRFPDVRFEHATGYKRADNVATYMARFYEGRAIAGLVAGNMTKSGVIGYIGSFPIPEVVRGINAFTIALRKVKPDAEVKVIWVNSWYDPGKEADAAKALIDQGADVLLQHTDSPAPIQVAEERGVWAVGQASDMTQFGPTAHLTAIVDNWDSYYVARAEQVMRGTWESGDTWGGMNTGMVEMSPYNPKIPEHVIKQAIQMEEDLKARLVHPFTGPIKKQDGTLVVADGETVSDEVLLGMDYYVEGVQGSLPK
ncbi:MAG: BMP family ABC transporter substrate-binding protein [Alphaproteobacteria bacterium]|nr:BMP family ABC transporter substrate-binding protein [Alphaproteobacteria bacterium]